MGGDLVPLPPDPMDRLMAEICESSIARMEFDGFCPRMAEADLKHAFIRELLEVSLGTQMNN